jgi:hypothetical protein
MNIKKIFYQIFKKIKVNKHMDKGMKKANHMKTKFKNSETNKKLII